MKFLLWFLALSLIVLSIVWISGALKAGLFIHDAQDFASQVDEHSIEPFWRDKKFVDVGGWPVAYIDRGSGEPIVLLHGCPFQSFEYSRVIPSLGRHYRVIAPDLLGLGDSIVRLDDDYRLPNQVRMVVGLLDRLGISRAHFVGHDHGGAIVQLMMNSHADRLGAAILPRRIWISRRPTPRPRHRRASVGGRVQPDDPVILLLVGFELARVAYLTEGPAHFLDHCHLFERRLQTLGRRVHRIHKGMASVLGRAPRLFGGGSRRLRSLS
jgi:pimeloyl-ACP methyl ester carboxylesterase